MRVLQVNKFFHARGGAERHFLDLVDLLPGVGIEVAPFAMAHPANLPSPFSRHFVPEVDYARPAGPIGSIATAARTLYNRETRHRVRALVREFRPDVAHLHNVHHQLSGSLIEELAGLGVPMVQTLHDYQWVCPVYTFLSGGAVCEACRGGRFVEAVRRRCQGGSRPKSAVAALDLWLARRRGWLDRIARFLAPSEFLRAKMIEHGLPAARTMRLGYLLRLDRYTARVERGTHALYAGRLAREKGVATLLAALAHVRDLDLVVAGTGPLEGELRGAAAALGGRVRFLGHLAGAALHEEIARAAFAVVPSEWYENQPFAVLEAFALGTPVLGTRIGGIPELVRPEETGLLVEAGSVDALAAGLAAMRRRDDLAAMGTRARALAARAFDPATRLAELASVYAEVAA